MKLTGFKTSARIAIAATLFAGSALAASLFGPLPGAIFTTLVDGTRVNANIYSAKEDVYLDGGPGANAPIGSAGLPDGHYYFQVTDPSGKDLLSTDPVQNRQFEVSGGIIVGLSGLGNHNTGLDVDHGATTVQLMPYLDTTNNGGVYKAWVTPIADFLGDPTQVDSEGYSPGNVHGFVPSCSKVDNYKVRRRGGSGLPCIDVLVFKDRNENGKLDSDPALNEFVFPNWPVVITDPSGATIGGTLYTGDDGTVSVCNLSPGTYTVSTEVPPDMALVSSSLDNVLVPYPVQVPVTNKDRFVGLGIRWR